MQSNINEKKASLEDFIKNKQFVKFYLYKNESIYGIPLKIEGQFFLLQQVDDFNIDGYFISRIVEIKEFRYNKYDRFAEKVLKAEKEFDKISLPEEITIATWYSTLKSFKETKDNIMITYFDEEYEDVTDFGRVIKLNETNFLFRPFDADGKWLPLYIIFYDSIYDIEFRTNYLNIYTKYLEDIPV